MIIDRRDFLSVRAAVLAGLLAALALPASGAGETPSIAEIEEAALAEGTLVWYAAMRTEDIDAIARRFMETYPGIGIEPIRVTSREITARVMTEHRGRRYNADIASASAFAVAQLNAEGLLEPFVLPEEVAEGLAEGTYDPEGYWLSQYVLTFPISYNPEKMAAEGLEVPTSFEDFTAPEWEGRFALSIPYYDWYQGLAGAIGREEAFDLATRIAANRPLLRDGSGTTLELLEAGEFAATFGVYGYNAYRNREAGRPVNFSNVDPVVAALQTGGIVANAPHPNAARLFQIWMASAETQAFLDGELGLPSTHLSVESPSEVWAPGEVRYQILDPDEQLEGAREFQEEFNRIFGIAQ